MTQLSLVPAGAGAGKTYHIQKTLGEWVENGKVAPGRRRSGRWEIVHRMFRA